MIMCKFEQFTKVIEQNHLNFWNVRANSKRAVWHPFFAITSSSGGKFDFKILKNLQKRKSHKCKKWAIIVNLIYHVDLIRSNYSENFKSFGHVKLSHLQKLKSKNCHKTAKSSPSFNFLEKRVPMRKNTSMVIILYSLCN